VLSSIHGQISKNWKTYLEESQGSSGIEFEQHGRTGRPLGGERFIEKAGPEGRWG